MPPRKKARISRAASPDLVVQPKSPSPAASDTSPTKDDQILADPWTDEEEIGLFKGLMRWKPTGIHKHFHLLSLHAWLLDHQHIHPRNQHTRPAGIWTKLNTLYDLSALDAREDARQLPPLPLAPTSDHPSPSAPRPGTQPESDGAEDADSDADAYSEAANKIEGREFALPPDEGFEALTWLRRFPGRRPIRGKRGAAAAASEWGNEGDADDGSSDRRSSSPALLPDLNLASEPPIDFTPSIRVEPEVGAGKAEGEEERPVKRKRGRRRKSDKEREEREREKEKEKEGRKKPSRRSARKAEMVAEAEAEAEAEVDVEAEVEAEVGGEDEEEGDEGEGEAEEDGEDEEDEVGESQAGTPVPRSTRARRRGPGAQTRSSRRSRR